MADLDLWSRKGTIINFADDTSTIYSDREEDKIVGELEEDSKQIINFMNSNSLCINPEKTAFLISGKRKKEKKTIKVGKNTITEKDSEKLLGMVMHKNQDWKPHKQGVTKKLQKSLGVIKMLSYELPKKILTTVGQALLISNIRYGCSLYVRPRLNNNDPKFGESKEMQTFQNKLMRIITRSKMDQLSTKELLEETNYQSVNHIVVYHLVMETKNCLYNGSSELLKEKLRSNPKKGRNVTRLESRGDLFVPLKLGSGDWLYWSTKVWNKVPYSIRQKLESEKYKVEDLKKKWHTLQAMQLDKQAESDFKNATQIWIEKHIPI